MQGARLSEVSLPAEEESQGNQGQVDKSCRKGDPFRPPDRRPRLQFQAQTRHRLPSGRRKGESLCVLQRPFHSLQGTGRSAPASFCQRPRRLRKSRADASARRKANDHHDLAKKEMIRRHGLAQNYTTRINYINKQTNAQD